MTSDIPADHPVYAACDRVRQIAYRLRSRPQDVAPTAAEWDVAYRLFALYFAPPVLAHPLPAGWKPVAAT